MYILQSCPNAKGFRGVKSVRDHAVMNPANCIKLCQSGKGYTLTTDHQLFRIPTTPGMAAAKRPQ
jgi:hypothetical protein